MEQTGHSGTFSETSRSGSPRESSSQPDVQSALRDAGNTVKDQARQAADEAKAAGGAQIAGVSKAVHKAADELGQELPHAASFIHAAAERLDQASSALRERSVEDLVAGFNKLARRQPAAAFAGSVLAGFMLSRFLKSSPVQSRNPRNLQG
jgi:hypothetical protein